MYLCIIGSTAEAGAKNRNQVWARTRVSYWRVRICMSDRVLLMPCEHHAPLVLYRMAPFLSSPQPLFADVTLVVRIAPDFCACRCRELHTAVDTSQYVISVPPSLPVPHPWCNDSVFYFVRTTWAVRGSWRTNLPQTSRWLSRLNASGER